MTAKSTIRETIVDTLGESTASMYPTYVDQVVEALEQREGLLKQAVIDIAEDRHGYGLEAEGVLDQAVDKAFPKPEPEPQVAALDTHEQVVEAVTSIGESVARLAGIVDGLVRFAQRNGYTG